MTWGEVSWLCIFLKQVTSIWDLLTLAALAAVVLGIPRPFETFGAAATTLFILGEVQGCARQHENDGHGYECG